MTDNLTKLIRKFTTFGWYGGTSLLDIRVEGQFEGWWGRASETWEYRTTIETREVRISDKIVIPRIKVVGNRRESADSVAGRFLTLLEKFYDDRQED